MAEKRILAATTVLYPAPVVLVSCGDFMGEKNALTVAWTGTVASDPPAVVIGIRPTRYSFGLIQRYGDFVVNLPGAEHVDILEYCGNVSGRTEDKFEKAGLTPGRPESVRAPLVNEFPVNIECKVKDRIPMGSHDLFIAEVMGVHVDPSVLTEGEIDAEKMRAIAYWNGKYYRLGEMVEKRTV